MKISGQSFFGRLYIHWENLGGIAPLREHLCHFMRVVFIWAPLRWFFLAKKKGITPAIGLGVLTAILFLIFAKSTLFSGLVFLIIIAATIIGVVILVPLVMFLFAGAGVLIERGLNYLLPVEDDENAYMYKLGGHLHVWIPALALFITLNILFLPSIILLWLIKSIPEAIMTIIILSVLGFSAYLLSRVIDWFTKLESFQISSKYLKARTEGLCPFVEII